MSDLVAARSLMAMSLGFHILFASVGIGLPLLMVIAEWRLRRTGDETYKILAERWAKGASILFAVGAVSGTVLSFELGLLWPGFMRFSGAIIGMPFSLEGFAFFTEAIFLGIYLYGRKYVSPRVHLLSAIGVALSGMLSGIFVVIANAWMNAPTGFDIDFAIKTHQARNIDPVAALFNPMVISQTLHMTLAAYAATGFLAAGIHAACLLKDRQNVFHRKALGIALWVGCIAAVLQPISGDLCAGTLAKLQPVKLAALEGQFKTEKGAPLRIGGFPDAEKGETPYAIEIPYMLSILAYHDPNHEVKGLNDVPHDLWPNTLVVHLAFQVMVGLGSAMMLAALWAALVFWRKRSLPDGTWFLRLLVALAPTGMIAIEAGWIVTEVGRQPWIIQGVLKTADAVTPMPGIIVPFVMFGLLYLFLAVSVVWLLFRQVAHSPGTLISIRD